MERDIKSRDVRDASAGQWERWFAVDRVQWRRFSKMAIARVLYAARDAGDHELADRAQAAYSRRNR